MRPANAVGILTILGGLLVVEAGLAAEQGKASSRPFWPFFSFQNGLGGVAMEDQPKLLKELGYDGIEFNGNPQQIPAMLAALDAQGLKMFTMYTGANLDPKKPPYHPGLKTAIERLKGRGTLLSLTILGAAPKASAELDDRAAAILDEIADAAEKSDLRIAMYPHVGFYVAKVDDAVRLAKRVNRKSVGVGFNLCHFLKLDDEKNLEAKIREASPYLLAVSVNGADSGETNAMPWSRLIQTLDRGSFDVARMLRVLRQIDYRGPVGLQCYAVPGESRENLTRSIRAWRELNARLGRE